MIACVCFLEETGGDSTASATPAYFQTELSLVEEVEKVPSLVEDYSTSETLST